MQDQEVRVRALATLCNTFVKGYTSEQQMEDMEKNMSEIPAEKQGLYLQTISEEVMKRASKAKSLTSQAATN